MRVFFSSSQLLPFRRKGAAITMGNYDGIHVGHRHILNRLKAEAKKRRLPSVVYTFEPHPVKLLSPDNAPPLINTLSQKIELFKSTGVDAVVIEPFTRDFSHLTPIDFFQKVVVGRLNAKFIAVGYDFTFGAKRHGNRETLEALCPQANINLEIVEPFFKGETLVSSSLVRKRVLEGRVAEVIPMLTRPFFMEGKIVRGEGRGARLGIPTANLAPENELIPTEGVYVTEIHLKGKKYGGATNIGFNPTFGNAKRTVETFIFGLKKNIYGQKARLFFLKRLRGEIKFASKEALVKQIRKDMGKARASLRGSPKG